jgi:hypothetical protein
MKRTIQLTPEMRVQLLHAQTLTIDVSELVVDAYKDGFMNGYQQEETLIDPDNEALSSARVYAS